MGEWKDGQRDGHGTYTFANGDEYVGDWKAYQMHGHGIYTYADGSVEEGVWKNSEFQYEKKFQNTFQKRTWKKRNENCAKGGSQMDSQILRVGTGS